MKTKDQRKAKIRDVKAKIRNYRDTPTKLVLRALGQDKDWNELQNELFLLRRNKTGSKHYSFEVMTLPNRRERRQTHAK